MDNQDAGQGLTAAAMGKLWVTYVGNTMSRCVLGYYLKHVEDAEIRTVVEGALNLSETLVRDIERIFVQEGFPIPAGFSEQDVDMEAPRLFLDEFYLHYLNYAGKAGLSIYTIAVPLVIRKDVRELFLHAMDGTVNMLVQVNETLERKGYGTRPPIIPVPVKVEFVQQQSYLHGIFGSKVRPLHAMEITHLYDNIENNVTSKGLLTAFSQVAKDEKVQQFMMKGKAIINRHLESCSEKLNKQQLPAPSLLDDLVTNSTVAPFSDKLMVWHKMDMFSMKIRTYANGLSLNGRPDIGAMYARFVANVGLYLEDGANILIDNGWMEEPPTAADRKELAEERNSRPRE